MSKKKANNSLNTAVEVKEKPSFMLKFVSIFVSVVLLFGIIFATALAVREANSALEYNGERMNSSGAHYFASYAKAYYLAHELSDVEGADDTPDFWNSNEKVLSVFCCVFSHFSAYDRHWHKAFVKFCIYLKIHI